MFTITTTFSLKIFISTKSDNQTKDAWEVPLKDKTENCTTKALEEVIQKENLITLVNY